MSASSSNSREIPLPESVESIIMDICRRQSHPPLNSYARRLLAEIGEQASMQILEMISSQRIHTSFSGYIAKMVKKYYSAQASLVLPGSQSSSTSSSGVRSPSCTSHFSSRQNQNAGSQSPGVAQDWGSSSNRPQSLFTPEVNNSKLNGAMKSTVCQQLLILNRLEFRKLFLVLSYTGRENLEAAISLDGARDILSKKDLPMANFESEIWYSYGKNYCDESDRSEYFDWDSGKTHLYYCHVHQDGNYHFKGPYLHVPSCIDSQVRRGWQE